MVPMTLKKCGDCGLPLEAQILGLSTGLGPEAVVCRRCGKPMATDRQRWPLRAGALVRFLLVSLFYLGLGGVIGGNTLYAGWAYWNGDPSPRNLPFDEPLFRQLALLGAGVVALVLLWKVLSAARSTSGGPQVDHLLSANLVFGAHLKVLLFFLSFTGIGWLKQKLG